MVCNQKEERKSVQAFNYDALFKKDERVVKVFVWEETKHECSFIPGRGIKMNIVRSLWAFQMNIVIGVLHDTHYIDCVWNIEEYDYIRKGMKNVLHVACFLLWKLLNNYCL